MAALLVFLTVINVYAQNTGPRIDLTPEESEYIASGKTVKIGYIQDRIPVSFMDSNGEFAGISRYIFDLVSSISGLEFEYSPLPLGDVTYQDLLDGGYDLVSSVEYNKENQSARGILISDPYLSSRKVVVARDGLVFRYDADLSIAISTGSQTIRKVLGASYPNFDIVDYPSIPACFDAVRSGEADLLMLNQYVVEYWISKPIYEKLQVMPVLGLDDQLCFSAVVAFGGGEGPSEQSGQILIDIINKAIAAMTEDELGSCTIKGIMDNQYKYTFSDFIYRYRMAVSILCVTLFVIIILVLLLIHLYLRIAENKADDRAQRRFLSTMSHEFRTPLNGLIGLNYLMSQHLDSEKNLRKYLKQSDVTANYLLSLVNDMLDMSSLQSENMELSLKPVDLELLTDTVNSITKNAMSGKKLEYSSDINLSVPCVMGDEVRIQQVLLHLLDNARKFTPEGGKVMFCIKQEMTPEGKVLTTSEISDTGTGISDELKHRVFDAFVQELDTVSKGNQGTGLGLTISRRLAQLMGGDLTLSSRKGEGSTFTFTLLSEPAELPKEDQNGEIVLPKSGLPRILVAEDNELNAEIILELLKDCGYEADHAENGRLALERFAESEVGYYGVVLMDLLMPEMNGFEAAKAIRALPRDDAKSVKIIACSANSSPDDRQKAIASGMQELIAKPLEMRKLIDAINK